MPLSCFYMGNTLRGRPDDLVAITISNPTIKCRSMNYQKIYGRSKEMNENHNDQTIVRQCGAFIASAWLVVSSEAPAKDASPSITPTTGVGEVQSEKIHYGPRQKGREYYDGGSRLNIPAMKRPRGFRPFRKGWESSSPLQLSRGISDVLVG